jgi:sugar phosphate isomerase/epimerase
LEVHLREDVPFDYEKIKGAMAECGIQISAVASGRLNTQGMVNMIDDRPYISAAAMQGMREYIRIAANLKTDVIIGWVKGNIPAGANPEVYTERLARNLTALGREAAEQGVRLFLEVINHYEVNILTTAKEIVDFFDAWKIPNCYAHLDTFHMNIEETDPVEAIRVCGKCLGYFHVADNTRWYPGSGTLDFAKYFSALEEIGYDGFVSVECLPEPDGNTAARRAIEHLKKCAASFQGE